MKTTMLNIFWLLPLTFAAPTDMFNTLDKRCSVTANGAGVWHEAGLSRRRVQFTSDGARHADGYCFFFNNSCSSNGCSNPQCWMDGGIGYADASYVLGPAGDDAYRKHRQQAVDAWAADSGCSAGGNA